MTLLAALDDLCALERGLRITSPVSATVKQAYNLAPDRKVALPDTPCWINAWTLTDRFGWGSLRIERYTITSQLFVRDADLHRGAEIATAFAGAFLEAWDNREQDLGGFVVGSDLRGRDPTLGMLEWAGQAYPGVSLMIDVEVPGGTSQGTFTDPVLDALNTWIAGLYPTWQGDPFTWRVTDAAPGYYWHWVTYPAAIDEPLTFDYAWMEGTVGVRVVTRGSTAREQAIVDLASKLSRAELDPIALADGSWLRVRNVRAWPQNDPRARAQVQADVRFAIDESQVMTGPPWNTGAPFGSLVLTYADTATPPDNGPVVTVTAP